MATLEAQLYKDTGGVLDYTPAAARTAGEVVQLADGRAAVVNTTLAASEKGSVATRGLFTVQKTASVVILDGQKLYWVKSTGKCNYTGDFPIGVAKGDATAAATTVLVELNVFPTPRISLDSGVWNEVETLGLGVIDMGHSKKLEFDNTSEAATAALYSGKTIPLADGPIFECWAAIYDIGAAALDISIGLANATHATDFDSVTESIIIHMDGASLDILAESEDGTTTVAATNTTVDAVDDTPFFIQIDCRTPADCQIYINGVNVLPATVFDISAATGPLLAIAHAEKTTSTSTADVRINEMTVRAGNEA